MARQLPAPKNKSLRAPKVDASGQFTFGEKDQDFAGFKKIICEALFIRSLIGEVLGDGVFIG